MNKRRLTAKSVRPVIDPESVPHHVPTPVTELPGGGQLDGVAVNVTVGVMVRVLVDVGLRVGDAVAATVRVGDGNGVSVMTSIGGTGDAPDAAGNSPTPGA